MLRRGIGRMHGLLVLLIAGAVAACSDAGTGPSRQGTEERLQVRANVAGTPISTLAVEITAADIATPLAFNVEVKDGVASGSFTVPAGSARTVTLRAFDARAVETHRGSATVDVVAGTNPTVSIVLNPLAGSVPVSASFGSVVVGVSPAAVQLAAGQTAQLTATIRDAAGNAVEGAVTWAVSNPALATVSSTGLVTARAAGPVEVVATYRGVAGTAQVAVAPAPGAVPAFASTAAGEAHSCGLSTTGAAFCWGANRFGQLGTADTTASITPRAVAGGHTFTSLDAAGFVTCGLTAGGQALCWGINDLGQHGNGTQTGSSQPVPVAGGHTFASLSVGWGVVCGVTREGAGYCWGNNGNGQLGTTTSETCTRGTEVIACSRTPAAVSGGHTFRSVQAGFWTVCGVTTADAALCWGNNNYGQIGNGTSSFAGGNIVNPAPVPVAGGLAFATVEPGAVHTCGVATSGAAYCWGANFAGELGAGNATMSTSPVAVLGGLAFASLRLNNENTVLAHTCGVTTSGALYCWGSNSGGQLGTRAATETCTVGSAGYACIKTPVEVTGGRRFAQVSAGMQHSCGVAAGVAYCWGDNGRGQLGDGTTVSSYTPRRVGGS